MGELRRIRESVLLGTHRVMEEWERITRREPWLSLPAQYGLDHLPNVIECVAHAALDDTAGEEERRRLVWAAATHGEQRLEHGFPEPLLFTEFHLLRRALWSFLDEEHSLRNAIHAIGRIDSAITLATVASLRGYHRALLERRGEWPGAIEQLVEEGPPTP